MSRIFRRKRNPVIVASPPPNWSPLVRVISGALSLYTAVHQGIARIWGLRLTVSSRTRLS